ncbi:MAG TPA: phosphoribosylanthranilate isomerase [Candidatus Eremiobacteraceae bacterium]
MRVKICGMTDASEITTCVAAGADALGFIFDVGPRGLNVEKAAALTAVTPPFVTTVGVFVNPTPELVRSAIDSCRLDVLQFSGDEDPIFCGSFGKPTIVGAGRRMPSREDLAAARAVAVMADSRTGEAYGGTGVPVPIETARALRSAAGRCFVLAGGLKPETVAAAIQAIRPDAVDVRSGVERDGRKNDALVRAFVLAARGAI